MNVDIHAMNAASWLYAYPSSQQIMSQSGYIGCLCGDFKNGEKGFDGTWADSPFQRLTADFSEVSDKMLDALSAKGGCGVLSSVDGMKAFFYERLGIDGNKERGLRIDTVQYTYMLRVSADSDNATAHSFYLYAYIAPWLKTHMENAKRGIRFITSDYKELFRLADGDKLRIVRADGEQVDRVCRYIDDYHFEIGQGAGNLYHICQFAEMMERNGNTIIPLHASLPEQCYNLLASTGEIIIVKKGESGFYKTDFPNVNREENRVLVDEMNEKLGVNRAQAVAMSAGSMFGWQVPAADPRNYDAQGRTVLKHRGQREQGEAR